MGIKKYAVTTYGNKKDPLVVVAVDNRNKPQDFEWGREAKWSLVVIKCTDRFTEDEYKELARVIADRLTAWETEKLLTGD